MTLFEYLVVAFSLVLSFAALRLVAGLPHAIEASRRYWVHIVHVCFMLVATAAAFWAQWSLRDVQWNFALFLIQFAGPGMVYFLACALIPDEPSNVRSWQEYFFSVRKTYFGGLCVWALVLVANSTLLLHTPVLHPFRLVQVGVFMLGVAGLSTDDPPAHRMILALAALVSIITAFVFLQPGGLAA